MNQPITTEATDQTPEQATVTNVATPNNAIQAVREEAIEAIRFGNNWTFFTDLMKSVSKDVKELSQIQDTDFSSAIRNINTITSRFASYIALLKEVQTYCDSEGSAAISGLLTNENWEWVAGLSVNSHKTPEYYFIEHYGETAWADGEPTSDARQRLYADYSVAMSTIAGAYDAIMALESKLKPAFEKHQQKGNPIPWLI